MLLIVGFLFSCVKEPIETVTQVEDLADDQKAIQTRASSAEYESNPNPYALNVMQSVCDDYGVAKTLEPTDLYVRFMPVDSMQLHSLRNDYGLELFDYPLDVDFNEGDVYVDQDISESGCSWVYTTVKPDFKFPTGIKYEIIEECYIPRDDEILISTKGEELTLEEAAYLSLGYSVEEGISTKGRETPTGVVQVKDDVTGTYEPIKGVKIRCHTWVRWSYAYTDESGCYTMDKKFLIKPNYAIIFENNKGFDIWGNWGPISVATYNMGKHTNQGWSANLEKNCDAWSWAAINNAAYEYYKMCEQTGINKPPYNLKIWTFQNVEESSAPMLNKLQELHLTYTPDNLAAILMVPLATVAVEIAWMLKFLLPDVTMGVLGDTYKSIYRTVNHELAHASHFSVVGSDFWSKYISYIITYGAYGDGKGYNAELCGIGEMWGFFMGPIREYEKYKIDYNRNYPYIITSGEWLKPHVFWDLYRDGILSTSQIFKCLSPGVETYNDLINAMCRKYPNSAKIIRETFAKYGIVVENQVYCANLTITTDRIFSGENILVTDVKVENGAKLTLNGSNSVMIEGDFSVEKNARFELSYNGE